MNTKKNIEKINQNKKNAKVHLYLELAIECLEDIEKSFEMLTDHLKQALKELSNNKKKEI